MDTRSLPLVFAREDGATSTRSNSVSTVLFFLTLEGGPIGSTYQGIHLHESYANEAPSWGRWVGVGVEG